MSGRDGSGGTEGSHANEGLPGSDGEHEMQDHLGTEDRARKFYRRNRPSASGLDPEGEGRHQIHTGISE